MPQLSASSLPVSELSPDSPALRRWLPLVKLAIAVLLAVTLVRMIAVSLHWPLIGDPALMHYAVFLIDHGRVPYRDIIGMNMPGTYLIHWALVHTLGPGDAAWRVFDLAWLALAGAAILVIAWPSDRLAALFGAGYFGIFHLSTTTPLADSGTRDYLMAILMLWGCAFFLLALRRSAARPGRAWCFFLSALCLGTASTIKPITIGLAILLLAAGFIEPRLIAEGRTSLRLRRASLRSCLCALAGFTLPLALVFVFLWREHALNAFRITLRTIAPLHAAMAHPPLRILLMDLVPLRELVIALLAIVFWALQPRFYRSRELWILAACTLFGAACYLFQLEGWIYHTYPFLAFLAAFAAVSFGHAIRRGGWLRLAALAILAIFALRIGPRALQLTREAAYPMETTRQMEGDLRAYGVSGTTDGEVQCIDMGEDCIPALLRSQTVQSTGLIYHYQIFLPGDLPVIRRLRQQFFDGIQAHPPKLILVTGESQSWPEWSAYLDTHYRMETERHMDLSTANPAAYRLYVRNDLLHNDLSSAP